MTVFAPYALENLQIDGYDIEDPDNCTSKLTEIQEEFQAVSLLKARREN